MTKTSSKRLGVQIESNANRCCGELRSWGSKQYWLLSLLGVLYVHYCPHQNAASVKTIEILTFQVRWHQNPKTGVVGVGLSASIDVGIVDV